MTIYHLGHRLAIAMAEKEVDKVTVAKEFGVKPPSVYDWLEHGRIAKHHIPHLLAYFGGTLDWWLSSSKGEPFPSTNHVAEQRNQYDGESGLKTAIAYLGNEIAKSAYLNSQMLADALTTFSKEPTDAKLQEHLNSLISTGKPSISKFSGLVESADFHPPLPTKQKNTI